MKEQEIIATLLKHSLKGKTIGLIGELGVGKTWFVNQFLSKFDVHFIDQISSPTFNYCNQYESTILKVDHYDVYRIEAEEFLWEIGIFESIENVEVLTWIEWANQFPCLLEQCDFLIHIEIKKTNQREYFLHCNF